MNFVYDDDIQWIELQPQSVNGKDGWSLVIRWDDNDGDPEPDEELLFEDTETLDAFASRLSVLLKREEIWS